MTGLKLKTVQQFPGEVREGVGVDVEKANGNWTISLDYDDLPIISPYVPQLGHYVLIYRADEDVYYLVPATSVSNPPTVVLSTGTAMGTSSAAAVGFGSSGGAASGAGTASAASIALAVGVGAAAGTGAANAVGSALVSVTLTGPTATLGTITPNNAIGAGGSTTASTFAETATTGNHAVTYTGSSIAANTKQRATVWIAQGAGLRNRFVRFEVGNNATPSSVTRGFFTELDLQLGTASAPTGLGDGVATGVSIVPAGTGYNVTLEGILSAGFSGTPSVHIMAESISGTFFYTGTAGNNNFNYESVGLFTYV